MAKQINQGGNQMKRKKLMALFMTTVVTASMLAGCGGGASTATDSSAAGAGSESADGDITDFTMFIAMPGSEINDGNEIQELIAQKTGVRVKETWLTGQTAEEAIGTIIAGGEYPDFIDGGDGTMSLLDAGALLPLDDYIEKYPNIKEMYSDAEWEKFRQEDGHIYWINVFQNSYGEDRQQPIMMKHSGFSARYWSGPDIHRLTLWTNISSY